MFTIRSVISAFLFSFLILHMGLSFALQSSGATPLKLDIKPYVRQLTIEEKNKINQVLSFPGKTSSTLKSAIEPAPLAASASQKPPTWNYLTTFNNEPQIYNNVLIGGDPQTGGRTIVNVVAIPITLKLHKQITAIDFLSSPPQFVFTKKNTTVSMTVPDQCGSFKKKTPFALVKESPLFKPADVRFGKTVLKNSQYIDAHQRASFWKETNGDKNNYHLWLNPTFTPELAIEVPFEKGVAFDSWFVFGNPACGTVAQVDFVWFDNYLRKTAIPNLTAKGVISPSKVPIFLIKNLGLAQNTDTFSIFALGYHDVVVSNKGGITNLQTYMVADVDMGALTLAPSDISVLGHELGEWVNNPFLNNFAPGFNIFGNPIPTEIADYLGGNVATAVSANGYTYHIQEMAFLPWFFGGTRSPSINGWYSSNGTLTTPYFRPQPLF